MDHPAFKWLHSLAATVALSLPLVASATLYCNRSYSELTENPGRPFNAVGFLNNGCTAFLIGPNHIATAAHCLVSTDTGMWQTDLRFYPNFHPDRVTRDSARVPRATVTRAVVGSRTGENVLGAGMDWGIARVENWQDTGGLDLTPISMSLSSPLVPGATLSNPAYTRHHFPYNDNDAVQWDNMQWDNTQCNWVGTNHGMWAMNLRPPPLVGPGTPDRVACNSRWMAGTMHADCRVARIDNDVVFHNCDTVGGSSGSPLLTRNRLGVWSVVAVGHGGGAADFSQNVPVCTQDTTDRHDNVGASADRFRHAPRFAHNIAVHRRPDNSRATMVFAVDSDLNQVVARSRSGNQPGFASPFTYWQAIGTPRADARLSKIAACSAGATARPSIFVVADENRIYTTSSSSAGVWLPWSEFQPPEGISRVTDIDATTDASGRCALVIATEPGAVYIRTQPTASSWGDWLTVAAGSYRAVTALRYGGTIQAAMIDQSSEIWRTSLTASGWTAPTRLPRPAGVNGWQDIDMTWDEAERGFMVATPTTGGNRLYFMPMYGTQPWSAWRWFDTHLWAPGQAAQPAPRLLSVSASRWMEDPAGMTSPVIFATDDTGNVYFIEYARLPATGWNLDWKSFYHQTIPYP